MSLLCCLIILLSLVLKTVKVSEKTVKKIYIAGPDVFLPSEKKEFAKAEKLKICSKFFFEGLCPLDNELSTAAEIANANFSLIDECDIIIADCNSFRGQEPDSGTMCEIGYGIAKGKTIVCYMDNIMPMRNRYGTVDKNGMSYENFGYPLNLMIATKAIIVEGDFEDAVKRMCLD